MMILRDYADFSGLPLQIYSLLFSTLLSAPKDLVIGTLSIGCLALGLPVEFSRGGEERKASGNMPYRVALSGCISPSHSQLL